MQPNQSTSCSASYAIRFHSCSALTSQEMILMLSDSTQKHVAHYVSRASYASRMHCCRVNSLRWHHSAFAPHKAAAECGQRVRWDVSKGPAQQQLREDQLIVAHVQLSSNTALGSDKALWAGRRQGVYYQ
jgi:hypothetical protein